MANRTTANFAKAQAKIAMDYNKAELRFTPPSTYLALKASGALMLSNYVELRKREDRAIDINYKLRAKRALGAGGRTHNHTGVKADTGIITPSWDIYDDTFSMSEKQADNSLYNAQEQLNHELGEMAANFTEGLEGKAIDFVFASRSGVNVATVEGAFDLVDDVFKITESTHGNRAIQITKSVMAVNKYSGRNLAVFCDTASFNKFESDAAQGAQNSTNLSFQYNGVEFIHSVGLGAKFAPLNAAAGYPLGAWVVAEKGQYGMLPWIPRQNRNGLDTKVARYSSFFNPIIGENLAVHEYWGSGDESANNGYTQDVLTQYEFSLDQTFVKAPIATANEEVFFAFVLV